VIGICAYAERASWTIWTDTPAVLLPARYVDAVGAAGGTPVLLPSVAHEAEVAADLLTRLDGLVLSGGGDLDPALYGAGRHPRTNGIRPDRDSSEAALARAALAAGLPLLGICRGMQLLTAVTGGTLVQHLPEVVGHDGHAPARATYGTHPVRLVPGTRLHKALGDEADVRSYHHQGIASVGEGWEVAAHAPDGTVEAIEARDHPFAVGVLWHPEVGTDPGVLAMLVDASCARGTE
jgi:putative glutamine amidotransferase